MLRYVRTALLLILPLSFLEAHDVMGQRTSTPRLERPDFCRSHNMIWNPTLVEWRRHECLGIQAINRGDHRAAAEHFEAMGSLMFHEAPMTGRFAPLALALEQSGEHDKAVIAIDMAFTIILIDAGYVKCDGEIDFKIIPNKFVDEIDSAILDDVGGRMCGPFFNLSNSSYGRGEINDLLKPYIGATEYEYIRRMIGFGRALPSK